MYQNLMDVVLADQAVHYPSAERDKVISQMSSAVAHFEADWDKML